MVFFSLRCLVIFTSIELNFHGTTLRPVKKIPFVKRSLRDGFGSISTSRLQTMLNQTITMRLQRWRRKKNVFQRISLRIDGATTPKERHNFHIGRAPCEGFYAATKRYVDTLVGLYAQISSANLNMFPQAAFSRLLNYEVLSKNNSAGCLFDLSQIVLERFGCI